MDFGRLPPAGYELQSEDSEYWAEVLQFEHWRSLDVQAKVRLLEEWNSAIHDLQIEALKREHPGSSPAELERLAAEARYGREFVAEFLGYRSGVNAAQ
jgi:hypothetical protein